MERLTLTRSEKREYKRTLKSAQRIERVRATLLTYRHKGTGINLKLIEWTITDTKREAPKQTAHVTVAGNIRKRHIYSRFLRITHQLWLPESEKWATCHMFTGPVVEVERSPIDGTLEINASSKDSQHIDPYFFLKPLSTRKGFQIHKAIRKGLVERGEQGRFRFPNKSRKLRKPQSKPAFNEKVEPWRVFERWANQIDRLLDYDGKGDPTLQRVRKAPVWRFTEGPKSTLLEASDRESILPVRDQVHLRGGTTKKKGDKKKRVVAKWKLRDGHRYSAKSLTGGKRSRVLLVEKDNIHRRSIAKRQVRRIGKRKAGKDEREQTVVSALIPFITAGDRVKVKGKRATVEVLEKSGATMEFGT